MKIKKECKITAIEGKTNSRMLITIVILTFSIIVIVAYKVVKILQTMYIKEIAKKSMKVINKDQN